MQCDPLALDAAGGNATSDRGVPERKAGHPLSRGRAFSGRAARSATSSRAYPRLSLETADSGQSCSSASLANRPRLVSERRTHVSEEVVGETGAKCRLLTAEIVEPLPEDLASRGFGLRRQNGPGRYRSGWSPAAASISRSS